VRVIEGNIADFEPRSSWFQAPAVAEHIALIEYRMGADVIFHAAGVSGEGVFRAAAEASTSERHLWAIGVDTDQWQTAPPGQRDHVLTSILIRWDQVHFDVIRDFVDGTLPSGTRLITLQDDVIGYSRSGNALSPGAIANLDRATDEIASGALTPPLEASGTLLEPDR
jgi:basic membrane protein A